MTSMASAAAMSVEEARRIRLQAQRGALDLTLPGTLDIVNQADRVCASAQLWGRTPADRRRTRYAVAGISAAVLTVVGVCMLPLPF